jgi:CheY-like chemotaxis protein
MRTPQILPVRILQVGSPASAGADLSGPLAIDIAAIDAVDDFPGAIQWLAATETPPQLVVLFQARPGQFSQADIESLRTLAPLARLWRVLGPWCEGETRSGHPSASCISLPWHQWPARLERELLAQRGGQLPEWSQPLTASSEERTLALAERPLPRAAGAGPTTVAIVAIVAPHAATAAALADVVRLGGYEPRVIAGGVEHRWSAAAALLWDAHADELCDPQAVAEVQAFAPSAALIALATFPRPADARRATELGVTAVMAKPYRVADLLESLAAAIRAVVRSASSK